MKKKVFKGLLVVLVLLVAVVMLNGSGVLVKEKEVKKDIPKKVEFELIKTFENEEKYLKKYPTIEEKVCPIKKENDNIFFINEKGGKLKEMKIKEIKFEDIVFTKKDKEKFKKGESVIKPTIEYNIIGNGLLLTEIHKEISFGEIGDSSRATYKSQILYNYKGEKILELPKYYQVFIKISTNKNYFITCPWGEGEGLGNINYYDLEGNLLNTFKNKSFTIHSIKFSKNGDIIVLEGMFRNGNLGINVINKRGEKSFEYVENKPHLIYISPNGNYIIISTNKKMLLLNRFGQIVWQKPSFRIFKCHFSLEKDCIIIETTLKEGKASKIPKIVKAISLTTGETIKMLNEGTTLKSIQDNNVFIIEEGGKIYEYEVEVYDKSATGEKQAEKKNND